MDAVVVGAGLAGLCAAIDLSRCGLDVRVVESSDRCGGRVATDVVDGFRLDRGFQVLNTSYPQLRRRLDLGALDLRALTAGALVRRGGRLRRVGNPLRSPSSAASTLLSGLFGPRDLACLAAYSARAGYATSHLLEAGTDIDAASAFVDAGLSADAIEGFLRPFLSGVLLESGLESSRRYVDLVWRSFVRGASVLPAAGIGAVGAALAGQLPPAVVTLNSTVRAVTPTSVDTDGATIRARAVVVATDPVTAARLLGQPAPRMRSVVTYYHRVDAPVLGESVIVLDGERDGPVVNTVELTAALPEYAPAGTTLISSSVLDPSVTERTVLAQLQRLYGVDASGWQLVSRVPVDEAQPAFLPGQAIAVPVTVGGVYVAGDHRATPSSQGAMASGTRVARAAMASLGVRA